MIPLRDTIPARSYPVVTVALIAANVVVFLHEIALGPYLEEFLSIPSRSRRLGSSGCQ
jgi:membrane associated rhomboid family serine protease